MTALSIVPLQNLFTFPARTTSIEGGRHLTEKAAAEQRAIPLSSPLEWKQALSGIPHSFFHTWEHSYAMHLTHGNPAFLYCAESEGVRVVCPFIERPFGEYIDIATPYGFSGFAGNGEFPNLPHYWNEFVQSRGYVSAFINLHPLFSRSSFTTQEERHVLKSLYFIHSSSEEETLLRACSESRRRTIRKWKASGASVVTERRALSRFVLDHYRGFFLRKNASMSYDFSETTIQFLLSLERVLVIGASKSGEIQAVHMTAYTPYAAEYLFYFGAPGAEQQSTGLIWEATRHLHELGIGRLSLGGGLVDGDNLDEFKRRFGAERRPLLALKQIIRPNVYLDLCRELPVEPADDIGYFPSYRVRQGRGIATDVRGH